MASPKIIKFYVGGQEFVSTEETLTKIPYIKSLLTIWSSDTPIFIDQDAKVFTHILNKVRNNDYNFPIKEPMLSNIKVMMDYLGLTIENKPIIIQEFKFTPSNFTFDTDKYHILSISLYEDCSFSLTIKNDLVHITNVTPSVIFDMAPVVYHRNTDRTFIMKTNVIDLIQNRGVLNISLVHIDNSWFGGKPEHRLTLRIGCYER